ncbi:MAG TPA: UDP-N-acetylmuramoyl-L-alanine--D-glutamate ligase [Patescibacteria group bacterium]|nr:UDP-N-acetylmuramoyl-L-alanine--D-glutamate ligase [Patescibacteria group bacterium]
MKIAIVGYGLEGQSSFEYFGQNKDNEITICDQDEELIIPEGVKSNLGYNYLENLDQFDLIVRSAGINPKIILDKNLNVKEKITSQLNEFLKIVDVKNVIGVTGTKGKGTTSTLIYEMLKTAGKNTILAGNIGVPFLNIIKDMLPDTFVVLELSSFQLIDLKQKSPHIAVCLMVVPEHLNWHLDLEEYKSAKTNLFKNQTDKDIAIFFSKNDSSVEITSSSSGQKIPYFESPGANVSENKIFIDNNEICNVADVKLLGPHNLQNICAAVTTAWQITKDKVAIKNVLTSFSGLPHRLELVGEKDNVKYYNDSFSTTPETAIAAINSFNQPELLIIGGQSKNIPFDKLAEEIKHKSNIAKVIVIGEATDEILTSFNKVGFANFVGSKAKNIDEIVVDIEIEVSKLKETDKELVVLFSPACTSFDMFRNYKERGELFRQKVKEIIS